MQYLKEMPCGNRKRVSQSTWMLDRYMSGYTQIIATSALTIYKMGDTASVSRPLKYGGRAQPGYHWNGA